MTFPASVSKSRPYKRVRVAPWIAIFVVVLVFLINTWMMSRLDSGKSDLATPKTTTETLERAKRILHCKRMRNYEDIKGCFPRQDLRWPLRDENCESIQSWKDVQRCLHGRFVPWNETIREIHVIGERNSG